MKILVTMTSGETDAWQDVSDAIEDGGALAVIAETEDEIPEGLKTVTMTRDVDQGPDLPPLAKTETFQVLSIYAPGMWMKVEFQ